MGQPKGPQPPRLPGERRDELARESGEFSDRYVGRSPGGPETFEIAAKIGKWYDVPSELINRARFDWQSTMDVSLDGGSADQSPPMHQGGSFRQWQGILTVEFLDLAIFEYPTCRYEEWDEMINSSSKGQWLRNGRHWKSPLKRMIRAAQRKVTAEMRAERRAGPRADTKKGKLTYPGHPKPVKMSRETGSAKG